MSQDEELEKILDKYGRYEYESGARLDGGFPKLTKNEAKQAIKALYRTREATLIMEARIDELKAISSTNHSAISAKSGKIGEWISIPNRIAELTNQQKGEQ